MTEESQSEGWRGQMETAAKVTLYTIAVLYGLGLLLTNIHLARFGVTDFSLIKARFVLVGLDFVVFLLLPVALVGIPWVSFWWTQGLPDAAKAPWGVHLSVALAVFITAFVALPTPFYHFIAGRSTTVWHAWGLYLRPGGLILLVSLACVVGFWFVTHRRHRPLMPIRMWIFGLFGFLGSMIPFAVHVYPDIHASVGGGQPQIVEFALKDMAPERMAVAPGLAVFQAQRQQSLLIHQSDDGFYVRTPPSTHTLYIPKESVAAMVAKRGHVTFRNGEVLAIVPQGSTIEVSRMNEGLGLTLEEAIRAQTPPSTGPSTTRATTAPTSLPTTTPISKG